jgi:4-amino-4-deoxy-L-arabinose transferase-like glycosyltransferase
MRPAFARAAYAAGATLLLAAFWVAADWSDRYLMHYGSFTPSRGDVTAKLNLLLFVLPATLLAVRALAGWGPSLLAAFDRLGRLRRTWLWTVAVALAVLLLAAGVRVGVLHEGPVTDDENVYEFQARIFLSGRLYLESQPPEVRPFFDNQYVVNNGKWYGLYFAGHPALLALATRLGLGEWLGPLAAALTVLLACGSARRLFGPRVAVLSGALLLVSPFFVTLSASHLSQPSSSLMLALFLYAWLRIQEAPRSAAWWAVAAAALAYGVLIRPQTAAAMSLPFLVCLAWRWRRGVVRPGLAGPAAAALILVAGAAIALSINHALTGNALRAGYHAYLDQGAKWVFPFGPYYTIREMSRALTELNFWLFGWPVSLLFVPFFARRDLAWALAAAPLAAVTWYGLVAVPSVVALGPIYYGECIVPLAILSASGIDRVASVLRERVGAALAGQALAWPLVATVAACLTFVPVQLASLQLMSGIARAPYDLVAARGLDRALVFVHGLPALHVEPGAWVYYHRNPRPDLSDPVLFVRDLGPERDKVLAARLAPRAPYVMGMRGGKLVLEPLPP